jgi:hypothetical protein
VRSEETDHPRCSRHAERNYRLGANRTRMDSLAQFPNKSTQLLLGRPDAAIESLVAFFEDRAAVSRPWSTPKPVVCQPSSSSQSLARPGSLPEKTTVRIGETKYSWRASRSDF